MNNYIDFWNGRVGYQEISRNSINQTFGFYMDFNQAVRTSYFRNMHEYSTVEFRSDLNYQLAIL